MLAPMKSPQCLLVIMLLPVVGYAKCMSYPPLMAKLEVYYCQPVVLSSSVYGKGSFAEHLPGQSHRATLISGEVREVSFVSLHPDEKTDFSGEPYIAIGSGHFELDGEASDVCPKEIPSTIFVTGHLRCCDVVPMQNSCISPLTRVKIENSPSRWHKLKVVRDGS